MASGSVQDLLKTIAANSAATKTAIDKLGSVLGATGAGLFGSQITVPGGGTHQTTPGVLKEILDTLQNPSKKVNKEEVDRGARMAEGLGKLTRSLSDMGEGARKATLSTTVAGTVAGGLQAAGGLAGAIPGPYGAAAKGILDLGAVTADLVDKSRKMAREVLDVDIGQGEFSGPMRAVAERQRVRDVIMSIRRGDILAESSERLAQWQTIEQQTRMSQELDLQKAKNEREITHAQRRAYFQEHPDEKGRIFNPFGWGDLDKDIAKWAKDKTVEGDWDAHKDIIDMAEKGWSTKYGRPPRFNP